MADYKKQNGEVAKIDDVQKIVEKALSDNNLNGILETEQIQSLVSFAESYQKTSAIDSKEVANTANMRILSYLMNLKIS